MPAPDLGPDDLLGPEGPLGALLPAFEQRPGQLEMARGVAEVLESGGVLAAEAPTGTGKSLAYLIPAALHSLRRRLPVAISTHTLNLQDQLLDKDVPLVEKALAARDIEEPLRVCVVKGRTNYLCRARWEEARRGTLPLAPGALERLLPWVIDTDSGDLGEAEEAVGPLGEDAERLAADPATCAWGRCRRGDDCFLRRLRRRAATANLVIVNHALLFNHLLRDSAFLPEADGLILDEAHHLERALTEACGRELSRARVHGLMGRAFGARGGERERAGEVTELPDLGGETAGRRGILGLALEKLRVLPSDIDRLNLSRTLAQVGESVRRAGALADAMLRAIGRRLPELATGGAPLSGGGAGEPLALRYSAENAAEVLGEEGRRTREAIAGVVRELRALAQALASAASSSRVPEEESGAVEVGGLAAEWERLASDLEDFASPADAEVCWVTIESGNAKLSSLPLAVAQTFAERVVDRFRATILTSATLVVAGSFDHLSGRLGLERHGRRLHVLELDSPFEHERQCVLLVDPGLPPPPAPGYSLALARSLESLLTRVPRRMLVLFTSNALLRRTHALLKPIAARLDRPLLAQGLDGTRHALARLHRRHPQSVLLGSASFWEGVDFPGEELEVLVITRLPFPVPGEPLVAARAEKLTEEGESAFSSLFLPEAVLRFRQGFGRLIRGLDDRGAVLCLDSRLLTATYRGVFARSLPVRPRIARGAESLAESVNAWFATGEVPACAADAESEPRRRGTARSPRSAASQVYEVDALDFDLAEEARVDRVDRAAKWQRRTYTTGDGSTITIERLRPAASEESAGTSDDSETP